jgi:hypothetical protein
MFNPGPKLPPDPEQKVFSTTEDNRTSGCMYRAKKVRRDQKYQGRPMPTPVNYKKIPVTLKRLLEIQDRQKSSSPHSAMRMSSEEQE